MLANVCSYIKEIVQQICPKYMSLVLSDVTLLGPAYGRVHCRRVLGSTVVHDDEVEGGLIEQIRKAREHQDLSVPALAQTLNVHQRPRAKRWARPCRRPGSP